MYILGKHPLAIFTKTEEKQEPALSTAQVALRRHLDQAVVSWLKWFKFKAGLFWHIFNHYLLLDLQAVHVPITSFKSESAESKLLYLWIWVTRELELISTQRTLYLLSSVLKYLSGPLCSNLTAKKSSMADFLSRSLNYLRVKFWALTIAH